MNIEHTWRMRVAHWFAAIIGAGLIATVAVILLTGAPISAFGTISIAVLLVILVAYITVGARILSNQPSPDASSVPTIRLVGWLVVVGVVTITAAILSTLLLVDNSVIRMLPGGNALFVVIIATSLALVVLIFALSKWLGSLKELEQGSKPQT